MSSHGDHTGRGFCTADPCTRPSVRFTDFLGEWATDSGKLAELAASFLAAHPFPYVVIEDFFAPGIADRIEHRFPVPHGTMPEWQVQVGDCKGLSLVLRRALLGS